MEELEAERMAAYPCSGENFPTGVSPPACPIRNSSCAQCGDLREPRAAGGQARGYRGGSPKTVPAGKKCVHGPEYHTVSGFRGHENETWV